MPNIDSTVNQTGKQIIVSILCVQTSATASLFFLMHVFPAAIFSFSVQGG